MIAVKGKKAERFTELEKGIIALFPPVVGGKNSGVLYRKKTRLGVEGRANHGRRMEYVSEREQFTARG
ncbi:hypothetical protein Desca_0869 [Desulfotomaculum nigrificans CO-1-SRB]|uniref:Uncharacterized protein n=1 Tax=Desulfotomaculum nigrificans (strain DSM 14880 / VKM B-2319 / CO-1-SRB) TaxID=868595 RepID=F6B9H2_DESCC|nr:hypothetical protein [Desulfotomaculum nigrificans]AEF93748.1 hypothetical protein Desca_0869 [Desulfotomaculum nigrificans CO-1-SRB]